MIPTRTTFPYALIARKFNIDYVVVLVIADLLTNGRRNPHLQGVFPITIDPAAFLIIRSVAGQMVDMREGRRDWSEGFDLLIPNAHNA